MYVCVRVCACAYVSTMQCNVFTDKFPARHAGGAGAAARTSEPPHRTRRRSRTDDKRRHSSLHIIFVLFQHASRQPTAGCCARASCIVNHRARCCCERRSPHIEPKRRRRRRDRRSHEHRGTLCWCGIINAFTLPRRSPALPLAHHTTTRHFPAVADFRLFQTNTHTHQTQRRWLEQRE